MLFILRLFLYSSSDSRTKNSHDHIASNIFMPFHMYQFGTYLCNLFPFIKPGVALRILQLVTWKKLEAIAVALDCQASRLLPGITGFALQNCLKLFALALCCRASCHLAISTSFSSLKKQSNSQLTAFTKHCCFLFRSEGES